MRRIGYFLLNSIPLTFLIFFYITREAICAYLIDIWKEAATEVPFWKWPDWKHIFKRVRP